MLGVVPLLGITAAIVVGAFLYVQFASRSQDASALSGLIGAIFWFGIGLSIIVGFDSAVGYVIIIAVVFIGLGNADRLSDRDLRATISRGFRR